MYSYYNMDAELAAEHWYNSDNYELREFISDDVEEIKEQIRSVWHEIEDILPDDAEDDYGLAEELSGYGYRDDYDDTDMDTIEEFKEVLKELQDILDQYKGTYAEYRRD